ncbi:hypothetical protein SAMN05444354_101757 [Stigmatella aurantiaca]|uniref:Uncharacterized protein n=1 Tax=Stigmatella aurantiaca TaxID=41 RepID=A0A1H7HSV3_STIAU|nr:hypothetical protein [Stigmatella aurantiaca]SEK51275.1 hypothetical protein SAMN05444354_101757 [Stigmatella aurantiaca]
MKPLLALSFGLLLGQTPPSTSSLPPDADVQDSAAIEFRDAWEEALEEASAADTAQPAGGTVASTLAPPPVTVLEPAQVSQSQATEGTGGSGPSASTEDAPAQAAAPPETAAQQPPLTLQQMGEEVQRLRAQVQTLQGQLETQQQESAAVAQGMGQELTGMRERAQELERLRTQNLALMQEASTWLAAADQSLDTGELDVDTALAEADAMLAEALQNASSAGRGNAAAQVQSARGFIAQALDAAGRRDVYYARWALLYAADRLRAAHGDTLDQQGTSALSP